MSHLRATNDTETCRNLELRFLSARRKHVCRASGLFDNLEETMTSLSDTGKRHGPCRSRTHPGR